MGFHSFSCLNVTLLCDLKCGYITSVSLSVGPSIHLRAHIRYIHTSSSVLVIFVVVVAEYLKEGPLEKRDLFFTSIVLGGAPHRGREGLVSGMALSMVVETCGVLAHTLVAQEIKNRNRKQSGTKYSQEAIPNYLLLPARHHFPTILESPKTAAAAGSSCGNTQDCGRWRRAEAQLLIERTLLCIYGDFGCQFSVVRIQEWSRWAMGLLL